MQQDAGEYVAYLLRMWQEDMDGSSLWRAALHNTQTREELYFANVDVLVGFLQERFSARAKPEPGLPGREPDDA